MYTYIYDSIGGHALKGKPANCLRSREKPRGDRGDGASLYPRTETESREEAGPRVEESLADLLAQREKLDAAIAAIQAIKGGTPLPSAGAPPGNGALPAKIESDTFFGLTIIEAAKKYLAMTKRPQKAPAITQALIQGGYMFTTENPGPVVSSLLGRDDAKGGEIVRVGRGSFGLASWYKNRPTSS